MADAGTASAATPSAIPSLSDSLTGYEKGLQQHTADVEKDLDTAKSVYETKSKAIDAREAALDPGAMKPPDLKPPPQVQATSPVQIWGSAAMWIAALGGIMSRRPLTNSLNAMAGVMKAYREMDQNAAQTAFDVWKVENENAIKMAQFTSDQYKTALQRVQDDRKGALDEFTVTAKALGDENAAWVAQHYGIDGAVRYQTGLDAHLDRMEKASADIAIKQQQLQNFFDIRDARENLTKAQKIGDPAGIKAAQDVLSSLLQQQRDLNNTLHPSSAGRGGGNSAEVTRLKDEYDKSVTTYNTVLKNIPGPGHDKEVADAKKNMDDAKKRYEDATGGQEPGAAPASTKPAVGAIPPRPAGVPPNAKYSPGQKKWWWEVNGKWVSKAV